MEVQPIHPEGYNRTLPVILLPLKEQEDESDKSLFKNESLSSQEIEKGEVKFLQSSGLPQVNQIRRFLQRGDRIQPKAFYGLKEEKQMTENKIPDRSSTSLYKSVRHIEYPLNEDERQAEIKRLYLSHKKHPSKLNFRTALYKFNKTSQEVQTDDIMIPEVQQQSETQTNPAYHQLHKPSYLTIEVEEGTLDMRKAKNIKESFYVEPDEEENNLLPRRGKKGVANRVKAMSNTSNNNKNYMNSYLKSMAKIDYSFHSNLTNYAHRYKQYGQQQTVFSKTIDVKPLKPLNQTLSNIVDINSDFKSQPTTAILEKNESRTTQQLPGGLSIKPITTAHNNLFSSSGMKGESRIESTIEHNVEVDRPKVVSTIQEATNEKESSMLPEYSREVQQYQNSRRHEKTMSRLMNRTSAFQSERQPKSDHENSVHIHKGSLSREVEEKRNELIQVPSIHEIKVGQGQSSVEKLIHPIRQNFGKSEMNWIQSTYLPKSDFLSKLSSTNFQIKKYQNGVYFGELSPEGKKSGKGVVFYFSGKVYEGDLVNDLKHGLGHEYYPDGSNYKGEFKEGVKHGRGVFEWNNGEIYDGEWDRGRKTGSGMWKSPEGESYIGEWKKDKVEGFGVFVMNNGSRYQGEFKNSLKHGTGTQRFNNGETFVGSYERNRPNGEGEYFWANGDYYKGFFSNGLRHRQGYFREGKTGIQYQGEYHNDKKCGFGQIHYGDNLVYRGNFQNNFRHGYGELVEDGKLKYRGYWVNDRQIDDENHQPLSSDPIASKVEEVFKEEKKKQEPIPQPVKPAARTIVRAKKVTEKVERNVKKESLSPNTDEESYKRACGCNRKH